jgi:hypothetical protein
LALTDAMAAVLRVVVLRPLLDGASIARECNDATSTLEQLVSRGFARINKSRKRDGRMAALYIATLKGRAALDSHAPAAARPRKRTGAPAAPASAGYACPELGRTCHRPGAYDAFALPSLIFDERRVPRSVA